MNMRLYHLGNRVLKLHHMLDSQPCSGYFTFLRQLLELIDAVRIAAYQGDSKDQCEVKGIKWRHIMDEQPKHGESIIQVDASYDGHYPMGMRDFTLYGTWDAYMEEVKRCRIPKPNFWWVPASEFPFPDKGEIE